LDDLDQARTMASCFVSTEAANTDGCPGGDLCDELDGLPTLDVIYAPPQQPVGLNQGVRLLQKVVAAL
jgi:hypothetical protein